MPAPIPTRPWLSSMPCRRSGLPVIEVHLSNIFRRDQFRQHSYVSLAATGVICGLGGKGYELAIEAMTDILSKGGNKA